MVLVVAADPAAAAAAELIVVGFTEASSSPVNTMLINCNWREVKVVAFG